MLNTECQVISAPPFGVLRTVTSWTVQCNQKLFYYIVKS